MAELLNITLERAVAPLGLPVSFPFGPAVYTVSYHLSRQPALVKRPFGKL